VQYLARLSPYGVPVLARRRPGGSGLAITARGCKHTSDLPSGCQDVSYSKQGNKARIRVPDSARTKEMAREPAPPGKAPPHRIPPKVCPGNGCQATVAGAWGRWEGAQGALIRPE